MTSNHKAHTINYRYMYHYCAPGQVSNFISEEVLNNNSLKQEIYLTADCIVKYGYLCRLAAFIPFTFNQRFRGQVLVWSAGPVAKHGADVELHAHLGTKLFDRVSRFLPRNLIGNFMLPYSLNFAVNIFKPLYAFIL